VYFWCTGEFRYVRGDRLGADMRGIRDTLLDVLDDLLVSLECPWVFRCA
jgi:hypothetical protein